MPYAEIKAKLSAKHYNAIVISQGCYDQKGMKFFPKTL